MKFSKKVLACLVIVSGLATGLGAVHQAQAATSGSSGGLWTGAVRNYVPHIDPYSGNMVWSSIVVFQASSLSACQAQMQPYLNSGATVVRPCQQGMVNLDNVTK